MLFGKPHISCFELQTQLAYPPPQKNTPFLLQRVINRQTIWLFRPGYMTDIFPKINKVNLLLQGK